MKYIINKFSYFIKYKKERKRLINKALRIIFFEVFFILISLFLLPFLFLLKLFFNLRLHEIKADRIGHLLLNTDLYLCKIHTKVRKAKKILIYFILQKKF